MIQNTTPTNTPKSEDFNTRLARFFLENGRLTLLTFFVFVLLGSISFFGLKTTGFPNPEIKIALIQTIYPQASAKTILDTVTTPLENAIKNVAGVDTFSSNSADSFSLIRINMLSNAKRDDVINKINTAISTVVLPTESKKPFVLTPNISGPDFVFTLYGDTASQVYLAQQSVEAKLKELPNTSNIKFTNKLEPVIEVSYSSQDLSKFGLTEQDITQAITNANLSVPVALNKILDSTKVNIIASTSLTNLQDVAGITLTSKNPADTSLKNLGSIATIKETYKQATDIGESGIRLQSGELITNAVNIIIKTKTGTDLTAYTSAVESKIKDIADTQVVKESQVVTKTKPVLLIENFSVNTQNQEQVSEIIGGLIGAPLKISNQFLAQFGWIFGALQLVFLVMLVFVSWRAAIVASFSIPLSLMSAMIYLYFTGNSLNTLVLFSLVLVIGLVVDPALVILESIQRKIDSGLKGKEAVLTAVTDIGPGLFAATLTNAIVFIPLALISGTLGQIFSYIPDTILPALIGSYLVPLVFLTYIGSKFLKRAPGKTENEQDNLWPFAKWLIAFNTKILHSSAWIRLGIVVVITSLSLSITGYLVSTGKIVVTQFSSSSDAPSLTLKITLPNNVTKEEQNKATSEVLKKAFANSNVISAYPFEEDYYLNLKLKSDGRTLKAKDIAVTINRDLESLKPSVEAVVEPLQNATPTSEYQVQLAINTADSVVGSKATQALSRIVKESCINKDKQFLFSGCADNTKVVEKTLDGYADFAQTTLTVLLDSKKLQEKGLSLTEIPPALLAGSQLRSGFASESDEPVTTISKLDGQELKVFIKQTDNFISSKETLSNFPLTSPITGQSVSLREVATITETVAQTSIGRLNGETLAQFQIKLKKEYADQANSANYEDSLLAYLKKDTDGGKKMIEASGLSIDKITTYTAGGNAEFNKSFSELGLALLLAIVIVYVVLSIFMRSFSLPIVVLYTIPVTFIGIFPTLATFTNGEFGFLEIIGLIILVGLVINAAIFLIDSARQQEEQGMDYKTAIATASGLRLRPVLLTKFTAVASLSPLVFSSEFYRNLSLVIISGIVVSGFLSLITTPILYVAFKNLSRYVRSLGKKKVLLKK